MPTPDNTKKSTPQNRKFPAYILAVYVLALVAGDFYKPQWFIALDWLVYLPLLPLVIISIASRDKP